MDLSEFLDLYQPFTSLPTQTEDFEHNNSVMSLSQSRVSNINNMLLQTLFPSEHTVKTYLYQDQDDNNKNSNCDQTTKSSNIVNLSVDRFCFKANSLFGTKRPELDHINEYDMASASIYSDVLDNLVSYFMYLNNLSLSTLDPNYYENPETYELYYEHWEASQSNKRFTYNDYAKLRGNSSLLTRLGYKLTLTLNTDNDEVKEPWSPNVAQKILSVEYSPLNLVKYCYQARAPLDQLECFLLAEVVKAFQEAEPVEWSESSLKVKTNPSPEKFVSICKKLKSLRKLCYNDKIVLLSNSFYEIVSKKMIFNYNPATDDWLNPEYGARFGRRDLFIWNRLLYDQTIPVIETLPDRWRKDEVVETLISLIIIFNPDQFGLLFTDSVRHEQYVYIHLLKRYLESICESPCDASDNLYRLLVGVEKFRELGKIVCESMNAFEIGFHRSLCNLIIDVFNNKRDYNL